MANDDAASVNETLQQLSAYGETGDLAGLWRDYLQVRASLWPSLTESQQNQISAHFREIAYSITGVSSMDELRPLLTASAPGPEAPDTTPSPEAQPQPIAEAPAPAPAAESAVPPSSATATPEAASGPPRGLPKSLIVAGGGILGLIVLAVVAVMAFGGSDDDDSSDTNQAAAPNATRPAATRPAATATTRPSPTPEPEPVLVATGDVEGSFEHVVAVITGDCSGLQLPSGPVQVGSVITGTGTWGLGALDPATNLLDLHTADGLAGKLDPENLSFEVATGDNARSGNGTFSEDGTSFEGKSFLSPAPGCSLELDSKATFASPLFTRETQTAAAPPSEATAAPTEAPPAPTQAPPAPTQAPAATQAPAPTQPPPTATQAPDIPALITAAVTGPYTQAQRAGNGSFLLSLLDPIAINFYGQQACTNWFAGISADPTFTIQINSITGPAAWTWQIFGETVGTVPDAYTLQVSLTQRGSTVSAAVHFAWDTTASHLRIFSPCRAPP